MAVEFITPELPVRKVKRRLTSTHYAGEEIHRRRQHSPGVVVAACGITNYWVCDGLKVTNSMPDVTCVNCLTILSEQEKADELPSRRL